MRRLVLVITSYSIHYTKLYEAEDTEACPHRQGELGVDPPELGDRALEGLEGCAIGPAQGDEDRVAGGNLELVLAALLAYIFNAESPLLDYYQRHYDY